MPTAFTYSTSGAHVARSERKNVEVEDVEHEGVESEGVEDEGVEDEGGEGEGEEHEGVEEGAGGRLSTSAAMFSLPGT
jgi:hypothetical protein